MGIDGILLVDKPEGCTSHDVVNKVRRKLNTKKVGHAGTLDPFATGLLIIGVGKATRLLEYFKDMHKTYDTGLLLGTITDTGDRTGEVMETRQFSDLTEEDVKRAIMDFRGKYDQIPPAYSAKKYNGERLYKLAREGKIINMPPKEVEIEDIENLEINLSTGTVNFRVTVSSGTYIRSLVTDIGYKLGCGATTTSLRRISTSGFSAAAAVSLEEVTPAILMDMTGATNFMATLLLTNDESAKVLNGGQVHANGIAGMAGSFGKNEVIRILNDTEKLIAVARSERTSSFIKTLIGKNSGERVAKLIKVFGE